MPSSATQFEDILQLTKKIATDNFLPIANVVDQSPIPPVANIRLLADNGLLGLSTPKECGGIGAPPAIIRNYTEILAAACGTTTFIQGQHQSGCTLISNGRNDALKAELLPLFASGHRILGVAFAHVRRPGPPMLRVSEVEGGYIFDGSAAWFTGWGVMTDVLMAGTLPNGDFVYVVIELLQGDALVASAPMKLASMNASGTVSLQCKSLFVPRHRTVKVISPENMSASDSLAVLSVTSQIFGVTEASLSLLREIFSRRETPEIGSVIIAIEQELATARSRVDYWRNATEMEDYYQRALDVRAACIEMGVRSAQAALTASGGSANQLDHSAQRLFREAMFYTLTAQTNDVRSATLNRLAESARAAAKREM